MARTESAGKEKPPIQQIAKGETRRVRALLQTPDKKVMDKRDRYIAYFKDGKKLPAAMEKTAHMMRAVFSMLCENHTLSHIEEFLEKQYEISQTASYRVISETKLVFGDVFAHNREAERVLMRMHLDNLYNECTNPSEKLEVLKLKAKVLGMLDKDQEAPLDPAKLNLTAQIIFTSDATVLRANEVEETQFTEV